MNLSLTALAYIFLPVKAVVFLKNSRGGNLPSLSILMPPFLIFFSLLHVKLSSPFSNFRLLDVFGYEYSSLPQYGSNLAKSPATTHLFKENRAQTCLLMSTINGAEHTKFALSSVVPLFATSNWLERELMEMHGFSILQKDDCRNLMLPYGDSSAPLQKILPSIGLREIAFDSLNDLITTRPVSIQF